MKDLTMNEMMEVNGGDGGVITGLVLGIVVEATSKAITGKSVSDHVADGMRSAYKSYVNSPKTSADRAAESTPIVRIFNGN